MFLEVVDLGHRFSNASWLFRDVTLRFEAGKTYGITGPSGSGKSTFLSLAAGWVSPTEGRALPTGIDRVSWVFQNSFGVPRRSALDHVVLPLLASGLARGEANVIATGLLETFHLAGVRERQFRALSGGEAQRLMLARAVAAQPHLLLIDEPTAQLDSATSVVVNEVMRSIADQGRVVLVATHDPGTADSCDEIIDMREYVDSPSRSRSAN